MKRTLTAVAALFLAFSSQAFELINSSETVRLDNVPKAIVSYDLAVLDTLSALDVEVVGVPKSNYEGNMAKLADKPVVGTLFEPDYEALKEINPDLIFAGGRSARAIPELEKYSPVAVFNTDVDNFISGFTQNNLNLAKAFGKEKQANKLLKSINSNTSKIQKQNKGQTGAFLFVINNNIMAHAPGDRFGYAYEITGLTSVLPAADNSKAPAARPAPGSPEAKAAAIERAKVITQVAQAEPDWLIVLDRGAINGAEKTAADTLTNHPELSQTKAFKNGKVFYVDPNPWYVISGGLANFKAITEEILRETNK